MWTLPRSPVVRVLEFWLLAVVPVVLLVGSAIAESHNHTLAFDFHRAYAPAIRHVLHGSSPYGPSTVAALSSQTAFVYPPLGAYLATPFAALPLHAADVLVTVLAVLSVPAILLLVGVRDWRCFGAALLWGPTLSAIHLGTTSLPMALGVALMWRWRDRPVRAGIVVGFVIALKLFLWPLIVWLVVTKRYRAAAVAAVSSVVLVLVPWIPLRGAGLLSYPHRLSILTSLEAKRGFSPAALLAHLGVGWGAAAALGYALGLAVLVWAYLRREDDGGALALVCAASLLLTPILWPNYLVIMLVPLAVLRPRFGIEWLLPLLLLGETIFAPPTWQIVVLLAVLAVLTAAALRPLRRRRPRLVLAWER
jgi:hypothetical protein